MSNTDNIPKKGEPGLKMKAIRSVKWSSISQLMSKVTSMIVTIFLARMLSKADFGLYALAFVIIDGLGLFKSIGIDKALIQRQEKVESAANTAFFIIPTLGLVLYGILWALTPFLADFYSDAPELPGVLRALGLFFVIFTFSKVPITLLEKEIKFDVIAKVNMTAQVLYSILALTLAFNGFGVWSLVIGFLSSSLIKCFLFWRCVKWRPKAEFDVKVAKEMFHFGKFVLFGSLIWFVQRSFDKVVIPKVLNIATLGIYSIATNLADIPSSFLGVKVSHVLFPTYSKLQGDMYNMRRAFLRVFKVVLMLCMPLTLGLFFVGGDFLVLAYGDKWVDAVPILQILAFTGLFNALGYAKGPILLSLNKPKIGFVLGSIKAAFLFIFLIPIGKSHGVIGISWFMLAINLLMFIVGQVIVFRFIGIKWNQFERVTRSTMVSSLTMSAVLVPVMMGIEGLGWHPIVELGVNVVAASVGYLAPLWIMEKKFILDLKDMVIKS